MLADVLYVHHDPSISGSGISLRNLLSALDRSRFAPRVAMFCDGPARQLYEALGVPVDIVPGQPFWTFPGPHWSELGYYLGLLALLPEPRWTAYLRKQDPAIVHVNDKACMQAGLAARRLGIPLIWHLRSSYAPCRSRLRAGISARMIRRSADALIAISEDEIDGFEACRNLQVIHNSVDFSVADQAIALRETTRAALGIRSDEVVIGFVATALTSMRGVWDFINAAGHVAEACRANLRFVIVGGESEEWRRAGDAAVSRADIRDRLVVTGFRRDSLALIAGFDVLVVCNHHGVMGRTPLEAMSVGTPVAAWQGHTGESSVVRAGETALIAPHGDVEALAQAVVCLVKDARLRSSMRARSMQYARDHFDPQKNARKVEQIYDAFVCAPRSDSVVLREERSAAHG